MDIPSSSEIWPTDKLVHYASNPRINDHAIEPLAAAIREFGFKVPIIAKSDGTVVDGHLRLKAAKRLNLEQVPVIVADDLTDAQIKAFRISINRMSDLPHWDHDLLSVEFEDLRDMGFDLELTGFDLDAIADIMGNDGPQDGLTDPDDVPEPPIEPVTKLGDMYQLGDHRLICGDSTDPAVVERLMGGEKADMVFTDPPYGMFLDTDFDQMFAADKNHRKTGKRFGDVVGDKSDFSPGLVGAIFQHFSDVEEVFIWGADYFSEFIPDRRDGSWVVWDKRIEENMDRVSGNTFELCWSKQKHKRLIARILWSGHHGMAVDDTKKRVHPTQKPTKLVSWFFDNWGGGCECVADLYGGSGSTMLACEQTGKQCRMVELDPIYCDVIVKRWEDFTGLNAEIIDG